jgi:hypothetical protein
MDPKGTTATVIGAIAIVAFGVFCVYLMKHVGAAQTEWDRLVYVFGGVEAIAFAAAGYFFGREVHRERANKAENKADKAEGDAKKEHGEKKEAETKLTSLRKYITAQKSTKTPQIVGLDHIRDLVTKRADLTAQIPDLTAAIETTHGVATRTEDERWSALERFAESL